MWGGGNTWRPSQDVHTIKDTHGKLQAIQMLYVCAEDKICFGMIGSKHCCRKPGCTIKSHKNNKFAMGSMGGWFIAAKSNQMKDPSAFVRPVLGLGLILGGSLFYARVTFETLVVFNLKVP